MVYIDAVHYEEGGNGNEYIARVKWTNELYFAAVNECSKRDMIDFINANPNLTKTKYYRYGTWVVGEDVHVVANTYIRTDANNLMSDNLGSLPKY